VAALATVVAAAAAAAGADVGAVVGATVAHDASPSEINAKGSERRRKLMKIPWKTEEQLLSKSALAPGAGPDYSGNRLIPKTIATPDAARHAAKSC